jgi:hypothetical protein
MHAPAAKSLRFAWLTCQVGAECLLLVTIINVNAAPNRIRGIRFHPPITYIPSLYMSDMPKLARTSDRIREKFNLANLYKLQKNNGTNSNPMILKFSNVFSLGP